MVQIRRGNRDNFGIFFFIVPQKHTLLFSWLSRMIIFDGVFFVLSFFPRDVLDEIWDLIELVSECFPTHFCDPSLEPSRQDGSTRGHNVCFNLEEKISLDYRQYFLISEARKLSINLIIPKVVSFTFYIRRSGPFTVLWVSKFHFTSYFSRKLWLHATERAV